jgi:uncharacterized membrane protein
MQTTILAIFIGTSRTVVVMCAAGILVSLIALWAAKTDIARAAGLEKIVALSNLCFSVPYAVFGALHLFGVEFVAPLVPSYMPWPLFWAYFVGVALLAASLSIATKIQVRWSGLLLGIVMFLFVAMMDIPGSLATPRDRFAWTLTLRELSFGSGAWIFAGSAMRGPAGRKLITIGRIVIAITAMFYGVEHFLHPLARPGVPLEALMPAWIPGRLLIGYITGAILLVAGACMLIARKTHMAATYLGTWIVLLVVFVYGPILIASLMDPSTGVKIEGINYFFDTLLFGGTILALASATPHTE